MKIVPKLMLQMRKAVETSMRIEGHATHMTPDRELAVMEWMAKEVVKVSAKPDEHSAAEAKAAGQSIPQDGEA